MSGGVHRDIFASTIPQQVNLAKGGGILSKEIMSVHLPELLQHGTVQQVSVKVCLLPVVASLALLNMKQHADLI